MEKFEFTLVVKGPDHSAPGFADRFHDAGFDDGLVSVVNGAIHIDLEREASSAEEAVWAAIRQAGNAGSSVIRVLHAI